MWVLEISFISLISWASYNLKSVIWVEVYLSSWIYSRSRTWLKYLFWISVFKGVIYISNVCHAVTLFSGWIQESRRAGGKPKRASIQIHSFSFLFFDWWFQLKKNKCGSGEGVSLLGFQPVGTQNEEPGTARLLSLSSEMSWKGKVPGIPAHLRPWLSVQGFPWVRRQWQRSVCVCVRARRMIVTVVAVSNLSPLGCFCPRLVSDWIITSS